MPFDPARDEVVSDLIALVQGYSVSPDSVATLKQAITTSSMSIVVEGMATPGVVEIDDELLYITQVDDGTGTCTVHPRGRGWNGTTPAAHSAGAVVTASPVLARSRAVKVINDCLSAVYPTLYGVGTVTASPTDGLVSLPATAEFVIDVRTLEGSEWCRVRTWEAESNIPGAATTRSVAVPRLGPDAQVQVVYGFRPQTLDAGNAAWSSTGLSPAVRDVVMLGCLARVASVIDLGRLSDRFDTARGDVQQPQIGAGMNMARVLKADYTAALQAEASALRSLYPARSHFTR